MKKESKGEKKEKKVLNPEADSLRDELITALAKNYDLIYLTNLDTGKNLYAYEHGNEVVQEFTDENFGELEDIKAKELEDFQRSIVHPDDWDDFAEAVRPEHIAEEFKTKDVCGVQYRINFNPPPQDPEYVYFETIFIKTHQFERTHNYVAALRNIDNIVREGKANVARLQDLLEKSEAAAKQKDEFIFNMSHDLNTPLNAIMGYLAMAKSELKQGSEAYEFLSKAELAGKHFVGMIEDVLNFSVSGGNKRRIEIQTITLRGFVEDTMALAEVYSPGKKMNLSSSVAENCSVCIKIDPMHLGQALSNILKNAINFTPEGGHVSLEVTQKPGKSAESGLFTFVIKDDGPGMNEELAEHAFEPFVRGETTTQSGVQGIGMGLSAVKSIVEDMGGKVWIETAPGEGTAVFIEIEADINATAEKIYAESQYPFNALAGKKILLVEDNEINAEIENHFLKEWGSNTEVAEDGKIAVDMVSEKEDSYDAILMDIQMPNMDGYEATQAIRNMGGNANADAPIIAVTANSTDKDREKAKEAGMNAHIGKPVIPVVLFDAICKSLNLPTKEELRKNKEDK